MMRKKYRNCFTATNTCSVAICVRVLSCWIIGFRMESSKPNSWMAKKNILSSPGFQRITIFTYQRAAYTASTFLAVLTSQSTFTPISNEEGKKRFDKEKIHLLFARVFGLGKRMKEELKMCNAVLTSLARFYSRESTRCVPSAKRKQEV